MPSNHLILCHPLLPPAFSLSQHQSLLQWVNSSHQVAKVLELQHQSFQWFPLGLTGLISLKSNLSSQHLSFKASVLLHVAFFIVQLSHPYMTTGKTIALTIQTFVGKVIALLFNTFLGLSSQPCLTQWNYEPCHVGPPKTDGLRWRVLTKCGTLEKGMANHFSILALRTPWTVWKGKKIGHWKMNCPGW